MNQLVYSWRSISDAPNARPDARCNVPRAVTTASMLSHPLCALDLGSCFCTSVTRRALPSGSHTFRTFPHGLRGYLWRPLALLICGACRTSCLRGKSIRGKCLLALFVFVFLARCLLRLGTDKNNACTFHIYKCSPRSSEANNKNYAEEEAFASALV